MTVDADAWLALTSLRAGHRNGRCQRAECAIAALADQDLDEIVHAITHADAARTGPTEVAAMRLVPDAAEATPSVAGTGSSGWPHDHRPPLGRPGRRVLDVLPGGSIAVAADSGSAIQAASDEDDEAERRFKVGDRVVYDSHALINAELADDYDRLGICTVTGLDGGEHGQLLSFVDQTGVLHDGWWASRFTAAPVAAPVEDRHRQGDVSYFVAFRSPAGYGYRVLDVRTKIVTAADVAALSDLLATELGGAVIPLNWIELPPDVGGTTRSRPTTTVDPGSAMPRRSVLAPIGIEPEKDPVRTAAAPPSAGAAQLPVRAAAAGDRPELPYLPRRAM